MYLKNKYTKCYYSIIERAKSRKKSSNALVEKHHIIPKSLGGNNRKENLIELTPREHFICHLLLPKMTEGINKRKMSFALSMMTASNKNHNRDYKITSKIYDLIKKLSSEAHKERWSDRTLKQDASTRLRTKWEDPVWREKQTDAIKAVWQDPELKKHQSDVQIKRWKDPELRKQQSDIQISIAKNNPEINKKKARPGKLNGMYGKTHTEEVKQKLANLRKTELAGKKYEELYGVKKAERIKKDRSNKLKDYIKNNPGIRSGGNNGRAKSTILTSPEGMEYYICGTLNEFCKKHNLSHGSFKNSLYSGKEIKGKNSGWKIRWG